MTAAVAEAGYAAPDDHYRLAIGGMSCAGCAARVETALRQVPGVAQATVNLAAETAAIVAAGGALRPSLLIGAVADAGYAAELVTGDAERERERQAAETRRARGELGRVVAAAALSLPLLLPMVGIGLPPWLAASLATPVQLVFGARFYRAAWGALRAGTGNMDLLVALGTSAAYGYGLAAVAGIVTGPPDFAAAAVVITLVLFGKWLEARARREAGAAIRQLIGLRPERARIVRGEREIEVAIAAVAAGDVVVVRPGERLPTDGRVLAGASEVDESLLSGESLPVAKAPGDTVTGGSINGSGLLRVETTAAGDQAVLARIIALVGDAQASKPSVQRLVDRVAARVVPIVLIASLITFAAWMIVAGDAAAGLDAAIAVLVITCPCALGLATPAALMVGTGAAARAGILIRDAEALERMPRIDTIMLDKTGTLTEGRPAVTEILTDGITEDALLAIAAAAQAGSEHPLARAIIARASRARASGLTLGAPSAFASHPGRGLTVRVDEKRVVIGNRALLAEHGLAPLREAEAQALEAAGRTVVWVAVLDPEPRTLGLIALADRLRPSAAAAVAQLQRAGIAIVLLTGDNPATAQSVAASLGIARVQAGMLPADKAAAVREQQRQGRVVAMVGDGVNDAAALAQADVGIAIGGGADAAMHAAAITLIRPDPLLVADAIAIGRATYRTIRQNLFWAFAYNLVGIPLAAVGVLSPMIAGAAMAFSSVSVVANALRLRRWHPSA